MKLYPGKTIDKPYYSNLTSLKRRSNHILSIQISAKQMFYGLVPYNKILLRLNKTFHLMGLNISKIIISDFVMKKQRCIYFVKIIQFVICEIITVYGLKRMNTRGSCAHFVNLLGSPCQV